MILITGATGQFGSKTIEHLINKGINNLEIAALIRNKAKAKELHQQGVDVRVGDYTDYESMVTAFENVTKLLLVSSNSKEIDNRTAHHVMAIKAAKAAGVHHLIYNSFVRKQSFENSAIATFLQSHLDTENFLKDSGMNYTILQNGIYLEMIPIFLGEKIAEIDRIFFPAQNGQASWVSREELAEATANILTSEGHENNTYNLTNTESNSYEDIAQELSSLLNKNVNYISPSIVDFQDTLRRHQVPEMYVQMLTMWSQALAEGMMDRKDSCLETLLGRKPITTREFLKKSLQSIPN